VEAKELIDDSTCSHCHGPLIEIDHYGERLIGCVECNRWRWRGSERIFMALPEEDLEALKVHVRRRA
jgi:hypothetical protein